MPRRKRKRRQRLERQEQREDAKAAGVPVAEQPPAPPAGRTAEAGVSYSGAAGGLLGAGMFFALAVAVLIDPGEGSRLWSIAFGFVGLCFLPAVFVSIVRDHPRRRPVLRITTVGLILLAMLGLAGFGIGFSLVLAPPTVMLAIGAGFIFQRSGSGA